MSMKAIKIEVDGSIGAVEITGETISAQNDSIYKYLGGYFDVVRMGRDACMLVDDEGLLKGLKQNLLAMMICGHPLLVGTALIVGTRPGPDGDEFCDAPERFIKLAEDLNGSDRVWEEADG